MDERCEQVVDLVGRIARTAMAPWGGVEACLDAYEAALQMTTELQLSTARAIGAEPMRAFIASCAHLTRDVGAAGLSSARWILDA
jgi:hypothetical protein